MKTERQRDQDVDERLRRENLERVEAGGCAPPVMVSVVPRYNEVDEKAENWDYCRDLRIAVTDGKNGARATLNGYGAPAGISLYHGDYVAELKAETAASAATVAELRAEVVKERERAEKFMWQVRDTCARAEAAERREVELEAELTKFRAEWQATLGWNGAVVYGTRANIGVIADALTGADPT